MKTLVTGANGFIGMALCDYLTSMGHVVLPLVRRPSDIANARVLDSYQDSELHKYLTGCDSVVHLAGRAHVMREHDIDPLKAFRSANVDPTINLARQAAMAGVKRFVFISTIKVNGEFTLKNHAFNADDEAAPEDAYAISKWEAEQELHRIAHETGMELVIIRPPLVYGPGVKGNFAELIKWVKKGLPLPLGAVHNRRSIIALDNLISFIAICADRLASPGITHQVFLVSDGIPVSTTELLRHIAAAYNCKLCLIPIPLGWISFFGRTFGKTGLVNRLCGSLVLNDTNARTLINWHPPVTMAEQLQKMADVASY